MTEKWTDMRQKAVEGYSVARERAVLLGKIGKLKLELLRLRRGIAGKIGDLGGRTYELLSEDSGADVGSDGISVGIVEKVKKLESEVARIEEEIERLSSQAPVEPDSEETAAASDG